MFGFISFIESFFLLSLGITFILIFLMVFHFKQRIEKLEKKNNNLSDLSNKIVKEITNLHSVYLQNQPQPRNYINPKEHICENIRITASIPITFDNNNNNNDNSSGPYKKIVVMDNIANDDNNDIMTIESDNDSEYDDDSELYSETESVFLEEVDIPINDNDTKDKEEIHLIKLYDSEEKEKEKEEQIFDDLERETIKEEVITPSYQKLSVAKLRILAISKGLCSDTSKIKRADLIKLLESETGEI